MPAPVAPEIDGGPEKLIKLGSGFYRYGHKYLK